MKTWVCSVCGYVHKGNKPKECPICASPKDCFIAKKTELVHKDEKIDVLIINGSTHNHNNTGIFVKTAEKELKKNNLSFKTVNLSEIKIDQCWCCYSMRNNACTYPCRNKSDDLPELQKIILDSKAMLVSSPINWNNMSSRLKIFFDRMTSIQNQGILTGKIPTTGKIAGIMVNGHEDGAMKTAMDIMLCLEQLGFILAPYGITFHTHGSDYDTKEDNKYFSKNLKIKKDVKGLVNNIKEMINLNIEKNVKDKIKTVCE